MTLRCRSTEPIRASAQSPSSAGSTRWRRRRSSACAESATRDTQHPRPRRASSFLFRYDRELGDGKFAAGDRCAPRQQQGQWWWWCRWWRRSGPFSVPTTALHGVRSAYSRRRGSISSTVTGTVRLPSTTTAAAAATIDGDVRERTEWPASCSPGSGTGFARYARE